MISALAVSLAPRAAKTDSTHSVEWARADIAINDADAAERERPKVSARTPPCMSVAVRDGSLRQSGRHMTLALNCKRMI